MRIAIHGTGRMAAAICRAVAGRDDVKVLALAGPNAPDWDNHQPWYPALDSLPEPPELLIDFTLPEGTVTAAKWCAEHRVPLLSGVTGLGSDAVTAINSAATRAPVLWSPNLSLGVNLVADLASRTAAVLDADVVVAIEDIHHQWKKDAPSGTALMLGRRIEEARGGDHSRIEFSSVREGETIGKHTVTFRLAGEEFSLVHKAHDRSIYALGALDAGAWLTRQAPGLYSAADWLSGRGRGRTNSPPQ
jgi:4-hydroxy-tetrahydrodipicolinate reductase